MKTRAEQVDEMIERIADAVTESEFRAVREAVNALRHALGTWSDHSRRLMDAMMDSVHARTEYRAMLKRLGR